MKTQKHHRHINWRAVIGLAAATAVVFAAVKFTTLFITPLQLKATDVYVEYKEKYDPLSNVNFVFMGDKDNVTLSGNVDANVIGDYKITYNYNGHTQTSTVHVRDTKGPQLEVQDLTVDMDEKVTPESFVLSAQDASKITYSFAQEDVDLEEAGRQRLTLVATDAQGNTTEKKVTFRRKDDTRAPEVDGTREDVTVKQGKDFTLDGLTVTDDLDPNPTISYDTATIDTTTPGQYSVKITAADRSGNTRDYTQKVTVEENLEYGNNVVYLTFDDGPSENTKKILDILDQYDAKATFFVTGNSQADNSYIKEAYDAGHAIGLHTYTHDYSTVYSSTDAYFDDLKKISDMVESITGEVSKVIRFPGGSSNTVSASYSQGIMTKLVDMVHEKGYEYFDWNVSSSDASGNDVAVSTIVASSTACEEQYCTVLMHDSLPKTTTVEALPQIIQYYKDKGYIFLPLTVDSPASHHGVNN